MQSLLRFIRLIFTIFYHILESFVLNFVPLQYRHKKNVRGEIVLITGAGGFIGRQLALEFAKLGCKVVCWDVAKSANEETAKLVEASGGEALAYQVDLRNREDIYQKAAVVKQEVGPVTILVNNAGVLFSNRDFLKTSDEEIVTTFQVNTLAHFWTVKAFLGGMIEKKQGHIVTVSSLLGLFGSNQVIDYSSSKFASYGFNESLKIELEVNKHRFIKTTAVFPYYVRTPLTNDLYSPIVDKLPRLEPEYVAQRIFEAVLTEEEFLILPRIFTILVMLNHMLPVKAMAAIGRYLLGSEGIRSTDDKKAN